ncbi:MAG: hypothetical protein MJE77_18385 [Proteobacteria bacterium]|nr:hypothetical protein [Pseudomonadota bacterium]
MKLARAIFRILLWIVLIRFFSGLRAESRAPSLAFMVLWWFAAVGALLFGLMAVAGVAWWCLPVAVLLVVIVMPWTVARRILVPLGMSRAARHVATLSGWTWGRDLRGGGLVAGAWALVRQPKLSRSALASLERARDRAPRLTAAQVLATGLIAMARGDGESARREIESVDELGVKTTPRMVHKLAREWLVADAAESGQWRRAAELSTGPCARSRITRLLGAIGARVSCSDKAPSSAVLWWRWFLAPGRRHTFRLVRTANSIPTRSATNRGHSHLRLATSLRPNCYLDALGSHIAVLIKHERNNLAGVDLESLAHIWDRALDDPDTRAMVMQRAALLGARSGDSALADLASSVAEDIADLARSADLALCDWRSNQHDCNVLAEAQRQLRDELMAEIELAFDALQERAVDERSLSAIDEWREWLSLRAIYRHAAALGGIELRRLAFPHMHAAVTKLAVWLWNERREYLMANAMFRWLLSEAMAVGDSEAIELHTRNWDESL